jgi:hypothetical protein
MAEIQLSGDVLDLIRDRTQRAFETLFYHERAVVQGRQDLGEAELRRDQQLRYFETLLADLRQVDSEWKPKSPERNGSP